MKELPKRKPNRLKNYDYSQNGAYFVTICAKNREELFGSVVPVGATVPGRPQVVLNDIGDAVETAILHNNRNDFIIDRYVIMPNHIHMIVVMSSEAGDRGRVEAGDRGRSPLQTEIRNMKAYITKKIGFSPWQKSFHDHIIRDENGYRRIAEYVENNPQTWTEDCFYTGGNQSV